MVVKHLSYFGTRFGCFGHCVLAASSHGHVLCMGKPSRVLLQRVATHAPNQLDAADKKTTCCLSTTPAHHHDDFFCSTLIRDALHAGLRALQGRKELSDLIGKVQNEMDKTTFPRGRPALLIKISPDLSTKDMDDIAAVVLHRKVDGLVVSNTTISRPECVQGHPAASETGGLSGKPLLELSTSVLRDMYAKTKGQVVLVGCGGVASGSQAYAKIRAGASLVEFYTGLVRFASCNA
jgi:hypothetical protein